MKKRSEKRPLTLVVRSLMIYFTTEMLVILQGVWCRRGEGVGKGISTGPTVRLVGLEQTRTYGNI